MQKTKNSALATHWRPYDTEHTHECFKACSISRDKIYKLVIMEDECNYEEYWIVDDDGNLSMVYMIANMGDFLTVKDAIVGKIEVKDFLAMSKEEKSRRFHLGKASV